MRVVDEMEKEEMSMLQREYHQIFKILENIEEGDINTIYQVVNSILYKLGNKGKNGLVVPRPSVDNY